MFRKRTVVLSFFSALLVLGACERTIVNSPPGNQPPGSSPPGSGSSSGPGGGQSNTNIGVRLSATPTSGAVPLRVKLDASVSGAGNNVNYLWTLPGAERPVKAGASYTTLVGDPGSYTFSVTASDGRGQAKANVTVEAAAPTPEPGDTPPVVRLSADPTEGVAPQAVKFNARASDPDGDALEYVWDFGDGTIASREATPTYTYEEPGYYLAKVIVTDGRGGIDVDEVSVYVDAPPVTLNLNVTPEETGWDVYSYDYYDEYYGVYEYGTGDRSIQLPAYNYYYVDTCAEGYECNYDNGFYAEPGETVNLSIELTPVEPEPVDPTVTDPADPTTTPDPTNPDPTTPDPTTPDPTNPDPTTPDPTTPDPSDPTSPDPTTPDPSDPTTPDPTTPDPTSPDPTTPDPTTPDPTTPDPTTPDPTNPDPSDPTNPDPTTPDPTTPDPTNPDPTNPDPSDGTDPTTPDPAPTVSQGLRNL